MNSKKRRPKRGELYWEILKVIGMAAIGGGSIIKPIMPLAIDEIIRLLGELRNLEANEKKIRKTLSCLEKKEIVSIIQNGSDIQVLLRDHNHPIIVKYSVKSILDFKKQQMKWDGKWFMVFFDVPEIQRNKRNYVRRYLIDLGFFPYQKSVYIFPYACEDEISLIKKAVESASYMKYIIAEKIEDEEQVKKFFHI
jgi:CRISPR-associated endonuclease Cas2